MSNTQEWLKCGQDVLIGNYARLPVVMTRGEGSVLFDADGEGATWICFQGLAGRCWGIIIQRRGRR